MSHGFIYSIGHNPGRRLSVPTPRNRTDSTSTHDVVIYIHVEDLRIDNKLNQSQPPNVGIRLGGPRFRKLRLFRLPRDVGVCRPIYRHRSLECKYLGFGGLIWLIFPRPLPVVEGIVRPYEELFASYCIRLALMQASHSTSYSVRNTSVFSMSVCKPREECTTRIRKCHGWLC